MASVHVVALLVVFYRILFNGKPFQKKFRKITTTTNSFLMKDIEKKTFHLILRIKLFPNKVKYNLQKVFVLLFFSS